MSVAANGKTTLHPSSKVLVWLDNGKLSAGDTFSSLKRVVEVDLSETKLPVILTYAAVGWLVASSAGLQPAMMMDWIEGALTPSPIIPEDLVAVPEIPADVADAKDLVGDALPAGVTPVLQKPSFASF